MKIRQIVFTTKDGNDATVSLDREERRITLDHSMRRIAEAPADELGPLTELIYLKLLPLLYGTTKNGNPECTSSECLDVADLVGKLY